MVVSQTHALTTVSLDDFHLKDMKIQLPSLGQKFPRTLYSAGLYNRPREEWTLAQELEVSVGSAILSDGAQERALEGRPGRDSWQQRRLPPDCLPQR